MKSFKGKITTCSEATVYDSRILMCPPNSCAELLTLKVTGLGWGGGTLGGNQVVSVEPHEGV